MQAQMILVAGPYRFGTSDDPVFIAKNVAAMTQASLQLFHAGQVFLWIGRPLTDAELLARRPPAGEGEWEWE